MMMMMMMMEMCLMFSMNFDKPILAYLYISIYKNVSMQSKLHLREDK